MKMSINEAIPGIIQMCLKNKTPIFNVNINYIEENNRLNYHTFKKILVNYLKENNAFIEDEAIINLYNRTNTSERDTMLLGAYIVYQFSDIISYNELITVDIVQRTWLPNNKFYSLLWGLNYEYKFFFKNK